MHAGNMELHLDLVLLDKVNMQGKAACTVGDTGTIPTGSAEVNSTVVAKHLLVMRGRQGMNVTLLERQG